MADEPDGINEAFATNTRVALTAAGLIAERIARARQQAQYDAQAASEQQARELQRRVDAERRVARVSLRPVEREQWWQRASAEQIGDAWQTANAWRDIDADAQRSAERIGDELRTRYAIDVDSLDADPSAVRDALERRERAHRLSLEARERAHQEQATAQLLLLRDADRADAIADPDRGVDRELASERYDSAERRRDLAVQLEGVADAETIEARVVSDTNQARPAAEALANGTSQRTPAARRTRGKSGQARSQPRRSDRGR
jgi:hypothetical protein